MNGQSAAMLSQEKEQGVWNQEMEMGKGAMAHGGRHSEQKQVRRRGRVRGSRPGRHDGAGQEWEVCRRFCEVGWLWWTSRANENQAWSWWLTSI